MYSGMAMMQHGQSEEDVDLSALDTRVLDYLIHVVQKELKDPAGLVERGPS